MPASNVDLVVLLDTSGSMAPCFDALRKHLSSLAEPMQGHVSKVRYGLVTCSVGKSDDRFIYACRGLDEVSVLDALYERHPNDAPELFSEDPGVLVSTLHSLEPSGDEDMLLALDLALDFPFGPVADTKRVIALFSDEPFEGNACFGERKDKIPDLIQKIQARRVQLFMALPLSPASEELAAADRSELEQVDGGDGLSNVDFKVLLSQMGKSISAASLQTTKEPPYTRALFAQDQWGRGKGNFDGMR